VTAHLLDTSLLIALAWPQHVHHAKAHEWFQSVGNSGWATCPLTQAAFIRISSNPKIIADAVAPRAALQVLQKIVALAGHRFWADDIAPTEAKTFTSAALVGHRQVTDAYLVALVQHRKGKLATFDRGVPELLQIHKERAQYITLVEA
jgi:uncharacterized protein